MSRSAFCTAALSLVFALGGCSKDPQAGAAGSASAAASSSASPLEAFFADDRAALTPVLYEQLILELATCKMTDSGIEPRCPANERLRRARSRNTVLKDLAAMNSAIGRRLLDHESPAVRFQAATMMQSFFGAEPASQKVVIDAAKKEKEGPVLLALLRVVGSRVKENTDVRALLLGYVDHPEEAVRREALGWLVSSFAEGLDEVWSRAAEKLEKDPSENVRAYVCDRLYGSSDERALASIKKLLADPATPKKVYQGCWNGLIKTWTGFPQPKKPLKAGYELTLEILKKKPRSADLPPWSGIATLRAAKTDFPPEDRIGADWYAAVKPWYKKDKLVAALLDLVNDPKANWLARTGALSVMQELGVPRAEFEKLEKKYASAKEGDDFNVHRRLVDVLARFGGVPAASASGVVVPVPKPPPHPPGGGGDPLGARR
jgi:hypothetical protein